MAINKGTRVIVPAWVRCLTRRWTSSTIAAFFISGGCTTATSPRAPQQPELGTKRSSPLDSSAIASVNGSIYVDAQLRYNLQVSSVIRVIAGDSTRRVDSTRVTGMLTTTFVAGPARNTVIARVQSDSVAVATGSSTSVPVSPARLSTFTIDTRNGRITPIHQEARQDCASDSTDSSPIDGREVLPGIHIPIVQSWTDTLHTSACRGGVLLSITRIAVYTPLQAPDSVLRVLRRTQFQISGNGRQWDQRVEVSGEGIATDTLRLSTFPLQLQELSGGSQMKFLFKTQLRTQEFTQTSATHVMLRNQ